MAVKKTSEPRLITNEDTLDELLKLLEGAKTSIDLLAFSFAIGSAGGKINFKAAPYTIAKKLADLRKKKQKLRIRLYIEGIRETGERNRVTAEFLAEAGIEVRMGATHAKGLCIDEKMVFLGSTNYTNQSLVKNNEANVLIEDETLASQFMEYYEHLWQGGTHGELEIGGPLLADGEFKDALIEMIEGAKKRIDFSIYFFNQRDIERALIAAHERGVKVRGFIHQHASFAYSYIRANRATVKRMRATGIEELYFGPKHLFSHSKFLVCDQKETAIGTGNWLNEDVEIHPQLYIHWKDSKLAKNLVKYLDWQIKTQATED